MWPDDPVYPSEGGYHAIAVEIVKAAYGQRNAITLKKQMLMPALRARPRGPENLHIAGESGEDV